MAGAHSWIGECSALASSLIWSWALVIYRRWGDGFGGFELNLFKNSVAALSFAGLFLFFHPDFSFDHRTFSQLSVSGIIGLALADGCLLAAIRRVGAAIASAVQCLVAPLAAGIYFLCFGESLSLKEVCAMALVLAGVSGVIIASSRGDVLPASLPKATFRSGMLLALIAAVSQAIGWVFARAAFQNIGFFEGAFLRILVTLPCLIAVVTYQKRLRLLVTDVLSHRKRLIFLTLAAFLGTFWGIVLASAAAKYSKVGVASALGSTYPLFVMPLAAWLAKERVSKAMVVFTAVAVMGVGWFFL